MDAHSTPFYEIKNLPQQPTNCFEVLFFLLNISVCTASCTCLNANVLYAGFKEAMGLCYGIVIL